MSYLTELDIFAFIHAKFCTCRIGGLLQLLVLVQVFLVPLYRAGFETSISDTAQ